jgi:hypothetical protein
VPGKVHERPQAIEQNVEKLQVSVKNVPVTRDFHVVHEKLHPVAREAVGNLKYFEEFYEKLDPKEKITTVPVHHDRIIE